jgi:hypothetical protein
MPDTVPLAEAGCNAAPSRGSTDESGEVNDPRLGFSVRHPSRRRIVERLSAELGISEAELRVDVPGESPKSFLQRRAGIHRDFRYQWKVETHDVQG